MSNLITIQGDKYKSNFTNEEIEVKRNKTNFPKFYRQKYMGFSKYIKWNQKVCDSNIL